MNWKVKAFIQNLISKLPSDFSYELYYRLQRKFGTLKNFNPEGRLNSGIGIARFIRKCGKEVKGKVVFELGTGRAPIAPLAFWLMGAEKVITADLNPYVKPELVKEALDYISKNKNSVVGLFGDFLDESRLSSLIEYFSEEEYSLEKFLSFCSIEYLAPCDARATNINNETVDYYVSCAVLEHIDLKTLQEIIAEGNRIVKSDGMFVNYIDYHDHFATHDKKISAINFLQYSDDEWKKYAGNRYMYMNRLRHDDYINLFEKAGHTLIAVNPTEDKRSEDLLKDGNFMLNEKFSKKDICILKIKEAMIATGKFTAVQ